MKRLILTLIALLVFFYGCAEDIEHSNPLDPKNPRTAGSPIGLQLFPGDQQVSITWIGLGLKGVEAYRIYRRYGEDFDSKFEKVAEIKSRWDLSRGKEVGNLDVEDVKCDLGPTLIQSSGGRYCYLDKNLKNDSKKYFYRISYVDSDQVEVPNPNLLSKTSAEFPIWPFINAIPSLPPDPPEVTLGPEKDLQVVLSWRNYKPPDDLDKYLIFSARVINDKEPSQLLIAGEKKAPLTSQDQFFLDGDFEKDGIVKVYKVVAVDKFGVESRSKTFKAKSPNLPPAPPRFRVSLFATGLDTYRAVIQWTKSRELDVIEYRIYSEKDDFGQIVWELREIINDINKTNTSLSDRVILAAEGLRPKKYFVTAVDNSKRDDGRPDESDKPSPVDVSFPQR